jgi:hypothetical protein
MTVSVRAPMAPVASAHVAVHRTTQPRWTNNERRDLRRDLGRLSTGSLPRALVWAPVPVWALVPVWAERPVGQASVVSAAGLARVRPPQLAGREASSWAFSSPCRSGAGPQVLPMRTMRAPKPVLQRWSQDRVPPRTAPNQAAEQASVRPRVPHSLAHCAQGSVLGRRQPPPGRAPDPAAGPRPTRRSTQPQRWLRSWPPGATGQCAPEA